MTTKIIDKKYFMHIIKSTYDIANFEFVSLDKIKKIKNKSASEIMIQDLLEYLSDEEMHDKLQTICDKLKTDGKLFIQGVDPRSISASLTYGQIPLSLFRTMVFGVGKKNIYAIAQIKELISSINDMKITEIKFINAIQYYIECQKILPIK